MKTKLWHAQILILATIDNVLELMHETMISRENVQQRLTSAEERTANPDEEYKKLEARLSDANALITTIVDPKIECFKFRPGGQRS